MATRTTALDRMVRGAARASGAFRAAVTLDGSENFTLSRKAWRGVDGFGGGSIDLVGNKSATYEELYRTQVWVHAIVNRYARSIGRLPLKGFFDAGTPGERERVREGPLAEWLRMPAPGMSPSAWKNAVVSNLMIHGNCVAAKVRSAPGVPPYALVPTSFAYWTVVRVDGAMQYQFNPGGGLPVSRWRPEEVVHFRFHATGTGLVASSSLEALRQTLMMEDATQRMIIAAFENGARPSGAFSVDGKVPKEVRERNEEALRQIFGGVDNTAKLAYLEGGAKWNAMSFNLVDSEVEKLRKLDREEVAAVFNMPPPVVGILDRATFSNITEQHLMEYVDTMQPVTTTIEETLQTQFIDPEAGFAGQYTEFDYGAVLAGDPVRQIDTLTKATGRPIMKLNEARERLNLPPVEGGDEMVTTNNMVGGAPSGA